ncbi:MAG: hypothetical protein HOW73_47495 [Polyangiaceae bacterium]|nr:hypothetical protein [Polyangiaceae bacterium]
MTTKGLETPSLPGTYGSPFVDESAVEDTESQQEAADYDKHALDTSQMSNTTVRARLAFPTVVSGFSTPLWTKTHWGNSDAFFPQSVERRGVGTYDLTYPPTFENQYEVDENVSFIDGDGHVASSTEAAHVQVAASGAVATVTIRDENFVLVDLTPGTLIVVELIS